MPDRDCWPSRTCAVVSSCRWFGLVFSLLMTSLAISCITMFNGNSDPAPAGLDAYRTIWPQGWSFFTDLAGDDRLVAYRVGVGSVLTQPEDQRTSWTTWHSGLSRDADEADLEIDKISTAIPNQYWQVCKLRTAGSCQVDSDPAHTLVLPNPVAAPTLCGLEAIAVERPASLKTHALPAYPWSLYRVAVVDLTCSD